MPRTQKRNAGGAGYADARAKDGVHRNQYNSDRRIARAQQARELRRPRFAHHRRREADENHGELVVSHRLRIVVRRVLWMRSPSSAVLARCIRVVPRVMQHLAE